MQTVTTIGLDIAKSVFQVHGVDAAGQVVIRRQLKRRYVLSFFETRELQGLGHTVRLMPPAYVKPYVKRQKNDAADAEAICEAVTRTNMRLFQSRRPSSKAGEREANADCAGHSDLRRMRAAGIRTIGMDGRDRPSRDAAGHRTRHFAEDRQANAVGRVARAARRLRRRARVAGVVPGEIPHVHRP